MRNGILAFTLVSTMAVAAPAFAAPIIYSNDFESGFGDLTTQGNVVVAAGQDYINLGSFSGSAASAQNHFAAFGGGNSSVGGNIVSVTFPDVIANQLYTLKFDYGVGGQSAADQYLRVSASNGSGTLGQATLDPLLTATSNLDVVFSSYTFSFMTGADTSPFVFSFLAGGAPRDNSDVFLDNIELRAGPVPEAGTWAMMIVGFGAVGGAMRRRRRGTDRLATVTA